MSEAILSVIPVLFVVGIVWLIIFSNKRINTALFNAAETLGFTSVLSKNIFRKKKIFGELDGYNCEVEVYTRSHGKSSTTYVSFFAYFPQSFDMGLKINWRGEFDGDDEYITGLFIKRNLENGIFILMYQLVFVRQTLMIWEKFLIRSQDQL